ncbi:hypothetical protein E3T43_07230 [Cryobacterium sp. Hh7]|uniref:hypothetical protein n=1 Tax=Cryobacterium sp. Hh7 TaxID=1259159 RepID=UPI00106919A0|nr:hypothetical protein [Cryobacterium sp. Hh7]TFD58033.1 hypothetical protein E3T43_07230 [Cryobacterium sp. Hh7]
MRGWDFAAGYGEFMTGLHAAAFMNSSRDSKIQKDPFDLPFPWPKVAAVEDVTPEERAALRASLERRSAFAR